MIKVNLVEIDKLNLWDDNPRINDHAVDAVAKSIKTFGFNVPILCDQNFTIIAGHTRWKAAKKLGMDKVPVIALEMNETQRKAFSIADNKTAEIADWDFPKLRDVLNELRIDDFDISNIGFSDDELRRFLIDEDIDEDEIPSEESVVLTKKGDLWILGNHRLLCGDSRDMDSIKYLMDGNHAEHVFAGPPCFNQKEFALWESYEEYIEDMRKVIENCRDVLKDGGVIVWNIANDCSSNIDLTSHHSRLLEESGMKHLDTIAWVKTGANYAIPRNFHIRRNRRYYPAFGWEALIVYQKPGNMPKMTMEDMKYMLEHDRNVWEIPAVTRQVENYGHTAVCPVEVPYRSILAYSGSEAIIFEPFGGSGTTLIAAEKAVGRAFLVEQHQKYCDIIVKRWETFTGKKAERIPVKVLA